MPYWIRSGEERFGPLNAGQVKKLAECGQLNPTDQVSSDQKRWVLVANVKGLSYVQKIEPEGEDEVDLDDEYRLAPLLDVQVAKSSADVTPEIMVSQPVATALPKTCHECGHAVHPLLKKGVPTGKSICVHCQVTPGFCPCCKASLRTEAARQCVGCGMSWRDVHYSDAKAVKTFKKKPTRQSGQKASCHHCSELKEPQFIYACPGCPNEVCNDCLRFQEPSIWSGLKGECPNCGSVCKAENLLSSGDRIKDNEKTNALRERSNRWRKELFKRDNFTPLLSLLATSSVLTLVAFFLQLTNIDEFQPRHFNTLKALFLIPWVSLAGYGFCYGAVFSPSVKNGYRFICFFPMLFFAGSTKVFDLLGVGLLRLVGYRPKKTLNEMLFVWREAVENKREPGIAKYKEVNSPRVNALFNVITVGCWIGLFFLYTNWDTVFPRGQPEEVQQVALPDWRNSEWISFEDPKNRFQCQIPPGWETRPGKSGDASNTVISWHTQQIRITVRETQKHTMYAGIKEEMEQGMVETARALGSDEKVTESEWMQLAESRALRIDMESKKNRRFSRIVKAKHNGWDHVLGMYLESTDQEEEFCEMFNEFLSRYQ